MRRPLLPLYLLVVSLGCCQGLNPSQATSSFDRVLWQKSSAAATPTTNPKSSPYDSAAALEAFFAPRFCSSCEVLSLDPPVVLMRGFLSPTHCAELVAAAEDEACEYGAGFVGSTVRSDQEDLRVPEAVVQAHREGQGLTPGLRGDDRHPARAQNDGHEPEQLLGGPLVLSEEELEALDQVCLGVLRREFGESL